VVLRVYARDGVLSVVLQFTPLSLDDALSVYLWTTISRVQMAFTTTGRLFYIVSLYLATRYPNHPLQVSLSLLRYVSAFDKKHGGYLAEPKMKLQGCFRCHRRQLKRAIGARSPQPNLTQHNPSPFGYVELNMELHTGEEVHPVSRPRDDRLS
jgi:hypothetical protein